MFTVACDHSDRSKRSAGKRLERRPIHFLKQALAGAFAFLEGALVELLQQFANGLVQFAEREELAMPQRGDDPTLGDLHARLRLWLCRGACAGAWATRPRHSARPSPGRWGLSPARSGTVSTTPVLVLSGTTSSGQPPRNSKVRTCAPIQETIC